MNAGTETPCRLQTAVPFTPRAEQPGRDEANSRVAVVTRTECGDEILERFPQPRVLVIRRLVGSSCVLLLVHDRILTPAFTRYSGTPPGLRGYSM